MDEASRITAVDEVPGDSTFLFRIRNGQGEREAILVRTDGGVEAWLNYCQHLTHVNLDKGSGAPLREGEVVCTNHGAMFEVDSGLCTFGPCEGAYLNGLDVTAEDGAVYLTDPDYEFAGYGGMEEDDADRSSTSNVEF